MKEYVVAVDIARKHDYYNIQVGKIVPQITPGSEVLGTAERVVHFLDIVHIDKFQRVGYEEAAKRVASIMRHRDLVSNADLLADGTGIGDASIELLRAQGLKPVPIIFTSGTAVREVRGASANVFSLTPGNPSLNRLAVLEEIHVPKVDLVDAGKQISQQRRYRVAAGLRWGDDFRKQIDGFHGRVNETTNRVTYEAETDRLHDDQVVCYLMMCWWMGRMSRQVKVPDGSFIHADEVLAAGSPYMED